jgi:hypothetical protein
MPKGLKNIIISNSDDMDVVEKINFNSDLDFELKVDFRNYNAT